MTRSVVINTRFPTVEEVAADLGISGKRLKDLLDLVEHTPNGNGSLKALAPEQASGQKAARKSDRSGS